jgi:uncharacterized membrane protein YhdT
METKILQERHEILWALRNDLMPLMAMKLATYLQSNKHDQTKVNLSLSLSLSLSFDFTSTLQNKVLSPVT